MAQTPTPSPETQAKQTGGDEPLARLFHMSTTAGVGTQEYVAINTFAVIAVVLGLASGLLMMGWDNPTVFFVLLVIPLAGLIFAIAAIAQIRGSNGTQAGIGWAIGGVLLSLVFAGFVTAHHVQSNIAAAKEQDAIKSLADRFGKALLAKDYAAAHNLFTVDFQAVWNLDAFRTQLERTLQLELLGKLQGVQASDLAAVEEYQGRKRAAGQMLFDFEKKPKAPIFTQYLKVGEEWRIAGGDLFPEQGPNPTGR